MDAWEGFSQWCGKWGFDVIQKAEEYVVLYNKYEKYRKGGVISGKKKMQDTFKKHLCLTDVFYAEFYAWEIFGKTKLGQLLLYAKQSQKRHMMKEVIQEVEPIIQTVIVTKKIDAIGFIPPTVKRQTQFMKVLQEVLAIPLPMINIVKVETDVITPQKTLNKLHDRIENADSTIFVTGQAKYKNILLIDDAIGSGATLNQVACKAKKAGVAKNVYGFALTGSVKGFDVISEV